MVGRVLLIDTGEEVVVFRLIGHHLQFVVAAVAEGSANDVTGLFLRLTVEREHHFSVRGLGVAHSVAVGDDELPLMEFFFHELCFVGPCACKM